MGGKSTTADDKRRGQWTHRTLSPVLTILNKVVLRSASSEYSEGGGREEGEIGPCVRCELERGGREGEGTNRTTMRGSRTSFSATSEARSSERERIAS